MPERLMQTGQGRVFFQKFASGPGHPYAYLGNAKLTGFTQGLGDITPVRNPSQAAYDQFDVVDEVRGDEDLPTTSLIGRFGLVNPILTTKCPFDVQAHYGKCLDPTDFIGGWDKILAFERARFTSKSSEDLTALESGDRAMITLTGEITARMLWEINPLLLAEEAGTEVILHVHDVVIYDSISCGECGWESEGDQKIYAICESSGPASAGLPPRLVYSFDRGGSWTIENITTIAQGSGEEPWRIAIVGGYAVVTLIDTNSVGAGRGVHHASLTDLSAWTHNDNSAFISESWAIFSLSATQTWLSGYAGDIYFMDDPTQEPELQGSATSAGGHILYDIHGCDSLNLVAVGEHNTVIYTTNGGKTWAAATGPLGANDAIWTVWARTPYFWIVGGDEMWYTKDQGVTWTRITLPVASITSVQSLVFADHTDSPFGYAVVCTATFGRILRTIDGGNSWYELPDGAGSTPTNFALNAIAAGRDGNYAIAGGVKGTGAIGDDGILISAA